MGSNANLGEALQFLREYDDEASNMCFRVGSAQWTYSTNMTDFNKRKMIDEQTRKAKFDKISWRKAAEFDWTRLPDPMARRQLRMLMSNSRASLSDDKYNEIYHLISEMKDLYAHIKVCPYNNFATVYCDLELDPDVKKLMAHSRSNAELMHIWKDWHDKVGPPMKNKFMRYVDLANQASRLNGFQNAGEEMRYSYEDENFESEVAQAFHKLQPLYKELFTYVRRQLFQRYGPNALRSNGPIPAHLLGNIWAQEWSNIEDLVRPYREYKKMDVTDEMLRQGFTPLRMFQMAEEFYTSLGLKPMPPEFWRYSMLERPNGRKVQCTVSAWDFCNKIDYRIKQCTEVNMEDLITIHHEMAHIQYYLHYADQPYLYRDGANPGFHEGIANAIGLSVFNPVHLHRVGLFNNSTDIYETNVNFLMTMALKKIAYAPFAYLVDQWRYQIFEYGVQTMNADWWELRLRFQGIVPPIKRTERHLDAAAKRHIIADMPYMRYFVALLLEFQIHASLCEAARHHGPLHTCDVYRSREAGRILMDVLKAGKSRHWKEVIRTVTRGASDSLSPQPMLDYFEPLLLWLQGKNKREDERIIGWSTRKEDTALFQPLLSTSNRLGVQWFSFVIILFVTFSL
ncbi:angiotensin-converting enzyme-like isoform X2 [Aethina tumida]|uniref:angiotensin-converting enzyme-like isoform X2 n=1 Tax=Aethina tumida TaxID=116153 RepID=UPI0021490DE8|nr:angiotensin-converting enzyme-like isoform X2 [Aethina tumida]